MNITLSILADELSHYYPGAAACGGSGFDLTETAIWHKGDPFDNPSCLYCLLPEEVPSIVNENVCLLLTQKTSKMLWLRHYLYLPQCSDLPLAMIRIQRTLLQLLNWQTKMLRLAARDTDITELLRISSPIFQNPLSFNSLLHDQIFSDTEGCRQDTPTWDRLISSFLEQEEKPYLSPETLSESHRKKSPSLFEMPGQKGRFIIANIFRGSIRIGTLTIAEENTPLKPCHFTYIKALGECLSMMFEHIPILPLDPLSHCLHQLLEGNAVPPEELADACHQFQWEPEGHTYRVAVIRALNKNTRHLFAADALFYRNLIARIYSKSKVFLYQDTIVLIRDFTQHDPLEEDIDSQDKFNILLKKIDACQGASLPFSVLNQAAIFYEQAKSVAQGIRPATAAPHEYSYYLAHDVIACFSRSHPLVHYIHPQILQLAEYDRKHRAHLMSSLYYYLINDRSYKICSEKYSIHRNSLLYRIQKATEIVTCDLSNENIKISILLSIYMYWFSHPEADPIGISLWNQGQ